MKHRDWTGLIMKMYKPMKEKVHIKTQIPAVLNWIYSLKTHVGFFFSSFFSWSEESRAIWKPVYSSQISNWLANVNFYTVAMGYRVLWFDTELQTLLISSIQFCPSLCITEPSGHLFTNKPLMAQIFSGLSLWHGRKCLHLSTRLDVLLVSHHKASFTGEGNSEE